jgi:uncharacterized protein YndB with AHSA1/START domain
MLISEYVVAMTPDRRASGVVSFPSDLEIVITRDFDAPIALVFDVLTNPEHVRRWGATPPDRMTECSIDLRVGGHHRSSFVTGDGSVFSFHGTYLEVDPPVRTVQTWVFDLWPDAEAVESMELQENDGVTTLSWKLAFRDQAGRDHMTSFGGHQDSLDAMDDILRSLLAA